MSISSDFLLYNWANIPELLHVRQQPSRNKLLGIAWTPQLHVHNRCLNLSNTASGGFKQKWTVSALKPCRESHPHEPLVWQVCVLQTPSRFQTHPHRLQSPSLRCHADVEPPAHPSLPTTTHGSPCHRRWSQSLHQLQQTVGEQFLNST